MSDGPKKCTNTHIIIQRLSMTQVSGATEGFCEDLFAGGGRKGCGKGRHGCERQVGKESQASGLSFKVDPDFVGLTLT